MELEIFFVNSNGNPVVLHGENLETLRDQLAEWAYEGPSLRVQNEQGFTVGFVSADSWRYV